MKDRYTTTVEKIRARSVNLGISDVLTKKQKEDVAARAEVHFHEEMHTWFKTKARLDTSQKGYHEEKMKEHKKTGEALFKFDCKTLIHTELDLQYSSETNTDQEHSSIVSESSEAATGKTTEGLASSGQSWKWEYVICCATGTEKFASENQIAEHAFQLPEHYIIREKANKRLDEITHYDNIEGGMAAVTRRNVFLDTPFKLLKVELTLSTGEERVLWVERRLVNIKADLNHRQRALKKWAANRPKLPLYIVECEFLTHSRTEEPLREAEEEEKEQQNEENREAHEHGVNAQTISQEQIGGYTGDIELERLPLLTFSDRKLANEHAGAMFLHHSAVNEAIRCPLDDFWWANNAVPIHKEAEQAAKAPGARYLAELSTQNMSSRVGFEWMRVAVYKVDDVSGPLNI